MTTKNVDPLMWHYDYPSYVAQVKKIGKDKGFHHAARIYAQDSSSTLWPDKKFLEDFKTQETGEGIPAADLPEIISLTESITLLATGKAFTQFFLLDAIKDYLEEKTTSIEIGKSPLASYFINKEKDEKTTNEILFWQCIRDEIFHQAALGKLTLYGFDEKSAHWIAIPANYFFFDLFFDIVNCQVEFNPFGLRFCMLSSAASKATALLEMEKTGKLLNLGMASS